MFNLRQFGINERSIFQHAVELGLAQPHIDLRPAGHIALESRARGGRYAYWMRYSQAKKLSKKYLGVEGSEAHLEAVAMLDEQKYMGAQAKVLRTLGFASVEHAASLVLAQLHNVGFFTGGGILVGACAFGAIVNHLGYTLTPAHKAEDIDLAIPISIEQALPNGEDGFLSVLKGSGLNFVEVLGSEKPSGPPTSFKVVGSDLMVELLVPASPSETPLTSRPVPELRARATALPFFSFLLEDSALAIVVGRSLLVPIRVPDPARYCFHKMVVATLRPSIDHRKATKDLMEAAVLAVILSEEDPECLFEVARSMDDIYRVCALESLPHVLAEMNRWPDAGRVLERALGAANSL